jgi:hypothetical protein
MRASLATLALMLAACGTDPSEEPVEVKPLQGQLNGDPWMAGGAVVRDAADDGEKTIYFHPDVGLTCQQYGDDPYLVAVVPWTPGVVKLGLDSPATVYFYLDATIYLVFDGRIELTETPTEIGATAPVRIRADFLDSDDDLHAEGEITVTVCE